jgi:uncharacterized protein with NRDE domain
MCLLAVVFQVHPEAPVVIAANRDERFARPAEPVQVLRPADPRVLGGRDALAGGTWLAVNAHGVWAGVTNRPTPNGRNAARRSRGVLPLIIAEHDQAAAGVAAFEEKVRCSEYNPCWLLAGDRTALFYIVVGGTERPEVTRLPAGIQVIENRALGAVSAKAAMVRGALAPVGGWRGPALVNGLHRVLRSHDLPAPGLPDDAGEEAGPRPAQVQAACVHTPAYGTRSASVVIVPAEPDRLPTMHYADGAPCTAPLVDVSPLWGADVEAKRGVTSPG